MKLATLRDGSRDGHLVLVSRDLALAVSARPHAATLAEAIEAWDQVAPALADLHQRLELRQAASAFAFDPAQVMAPLPRTFQWCDGSAFLQHGQRMQQAFGLPPIADVDRIPLMYQGAGDDFLGAREAIQVADPVYGIDFEGEFAVVVDDVPMGCTAAEAERHIKLIVQLNDVSLRSMAPREMSTGFGFIHAKPSTSFAPVAITPDELGEGWQGGRVRLRLQTELNGEWFGHPCAGQMHFSFPQLIAHAALTRRLGAGTIIGSGTVSSANEADGFSCISERRAVDKIRGRELTEYLQFGDVVRMRALDEQGAAPFGSIEQVVTAAPQPGGR
ncbi:fumarylacetoacetate hydrolase family protein [Pseudomonas sp. A2]|uniref:fumarylacetoacetate hydrolase family protein n=1 Tax=Pseudomonas sp. A2 TaxID=107445 RepID=UPI002ACD0A20|nr:fumarylacetoacetate hydrolase family protein [Pseudomonas sp. A2]MEB3440352.1 fumarylacetoacetate hydrolase family protein [Pseudomonas sp. A2]HEN8736038.1 fumarylacetoacetate hydrolase family protein [Pseudomonas putida]